VGRVERSYVGIVLAVRVAVVGLAARERGELVGDDFVRSDRHRVVRLARGALRDPAARVLERGDVAAVVDELQDAGELGAVVLRDRHERVQHRVVDVLAGVVQSGRRGRGAGSARRRDGRCGRAYSRVELTP
jgi:hypothetical protein